MSNNIYSDSIRKVAFSDAFDEKTISAMEAAARGAKKQPARKRFKWQYAALSAAACVLLIMAVTAMPMLQNTQPGTATNLQNAASVVENTPAKATASPAVAIQVVDAAKYASQSMDSMATPKPGDVFLEYDVWQAVNDPATDEEYFFVELYINGDVGASELGTSDRYVYNGKTIAEWRELAALANEVYPYYEYNGDHGGDVSKEEYDAAVAEAKSLDAITNLDAAEQEYAAKYDAAYADREKLRLEAIENECARLKRLGYDARAYETWTYQGEGEKQNRIVLAGLFTKEQLKRLQTSDANPDIGILLSWMRNGDGIAKFDSAKWE